MFPGNPGDRCRWVVCRTGFGLYGSSTRWTELRVNLMPDVSVLTAAGRAVPHHLAAAHRSLSDQGDIDWEWVIQVDGVRRRLPDAVVQDGRVSIEANGHHRGIAITRNRALMRCQADHVQNLDDDDVLLPDALVVLRAALDAHPECAFAFGDGYRCDDEGRPIASGKAPSGVLAPGELFDRWLRDDYGKLAALPLAPGGVMWRRTVLFGEGGWRALSGSEDTALVMSAADFPCIGVGVPTLGIREHAGRTTRSPELRAMKAQHWDFVRRQVLAQRALQDSMWRADLRSRD